jgi:hydrogenase/urease accessory protein HupE
MTYTHSAEDPADDPYSGYSNEHAAAAGETGQRSLMALVGVGLMLGVVHVLTGPDHLTALMSLSVRASTVCLPSNQLLRYMSMES